MNFCTKIGKPLREEAGGSRSSNSSQIKLCKASAWRFKQSQRLVPPWRIAGQEGANQIEPTPYAKAEPSYLRWQVRYTISTHKPNDPSGRPSESYLYLAHADQDSRCKGAKVGRPDEEGAGELSELGIRQRVLLTWQLGDRLSPTCFENRYGTNSRVSRTPHCCKPPLRHTGPQAALEQRGRTCSRRFVLWDFLPDLPNINSFQDF